MSEMNKIFYFYYYYYLNKDQSNQITRLVQFKTKRYFDIKCSLLILESLTKMSHQKTNRVAQLSWFQMTPF